MKLEFVFLLNLLKLFYTSSVWVELLGSMLCRERFFFTNQQQKHEKKKHMARNTVKEKVVYFIVNCFHVLILAQKKKQYN